MNRACLTKNVNLHEQNQHASCIRPIKINFVRMKTIKLIFVIVLVVAFGATKADWDSKTKMIAVTFDPSKTSVDALSKKLASVGHDTEKYKADDKVYDALPTCCHYDRSK